MDGAAATAAAGLLRCAASLPQVDPNAIKLSGAGMANPFPPEENYPLSPRPPHCCGNCWAPAYNRGARAEPLSRVRPWQARNPAGAGERRR
jgi:hypothetical protein